MTETVARNKPKSNATKPATVITPATVNEMVSEPKPPVVTTEKTDPLTAFSILKDELKKLDEEYTANRTAIVEKMRDFKSQINQVFSGIPELTTPNPPTTDAKQVPTLPADKLQPWIRSTIGKDEMSWEDVQAKFVKAYPGYRKPRKDHAVKAGVVVETTGGKVKVSSM